MPNDLPEVSVTLPSPETAPAPSPAYTPPTVTKGMFSAADLQAPLDRIPAAPAAPVKYTPTPEELNNATPVAPIKYTPTADELNSAVPAPAPKGVNIFEAMTPEQMVTEAKANPKTFDPVAAFQALPSDEQAKNYDKAAETFHQLRQAGGTPGAMDMLKNAGKGIWDLAKEGAQLASRAVAAPITVPTILTEDNLDPATFRGALALQERQQAGEFLAGQKMAGLGLGQMLTKGADWAGRGLHLTKQLNDYTPEDKLSAFGAELATRNGMSRLVKNGIDERSTSDLAKQGYGLRPEKVEQAASGSPFAWEGAGMLFGTASGMVADSAAPLLATIAGDSSPAGVAAAQAALHSLPTAASDLSAKAVGKGIQLAGKGGEKLTELVQPIVKPVALAGGAVGGVVAAHHLGGPLTIPIGVAEGITRGAEVAEKIKKGLDFTGSKLNDLSELGRQVATGKDVTSSAAQAARDIAMAAPGAAAHVAAGAGMDVALGAATTGTPEERAGVTPFGAVLGSAGALKGAGKRVASGYILSPRNWGSAGTPARPEAFKNNFPALNAEHAEAIAAAEPGIRQRYNAIQKYVDGAAPGTQIVYAPKPEAGQEDTLPAALQQSGISPDFAQQDAVNTKVNGQNIVVVRDLEAAPHEARHAMDDVLGASGVRELNATAQKVYADKWDAFKQQYADRVNNAVHGMDTSDPDGTILRETGTGNAAAKEKILGQAREALGPDAPEESVKTEAGKAITDLQAQAQSEGKDFWQHVLTPEEQTDAVNQYVGSEIRAEHHDAWFKAGQPGGMREKANQVLTALGINSAEGRASTYGTPLEGSLVSQAAKTGTVKPTVEPKAALEGSDQFRQQAEVNAQQAAANASSQPVPGAVQSPREILGVVGEAIARGQGIKLDGLFAPEEPAASLTSDRETRRQMIETYRTMPDSAKKLWGKLFFPENVPVTARSGNLQVFGWSPEVFAANAHKAAGALSALADKGVDLGQLGVKYELDPVTKTFTEKGWRDLYDDVQKFTQNQKAGRTGAGNPLVVPESVSKAGAYAPPVRGETAPLDQNSADFINFLFHAKLPDTGIARQGAINLPLNVAGQLVSEATTKAAGAESRVEPPVTPRGSFRGAVASRQGVKGLPIAEVNPFRNRFESALQQSGVENPSLIEVNQRLNLKNIKQAQLAPEQGKFGANTLTLQAGFQPPKSPMDFANFLDTSNPEDYRNTVSGYKGKYGGGQTGLSFDTGAQISTPEELARLTSARSKFEQLSQAALRTKDFPTAIDAASKAQAAREAIEAATDSGGSGDFIRKYYDPTFQGSPLHQNLHAEQVSFQPPTGDKRAIRAAAVKDSKTGDVFEGPMHLVAYQKMTESGYKPQELLGHKEGFVTNTPGEFLDRNEAYKRAVELGQYVPERKGEWLESEALRKQNIARISAERAGQPYSVGQFQAPRAANEDVRKVAEDYAGPGYTPHTGYDVLTEDRAKNIADAYDEAKHDPENPQVKSAYDALKTETADQWNALKAAGYIMEPWTKPGQPYATSAEMAADVRNNKHIYYFPTDVGYGEGGAVADHPMLEDSGLTAGGKSIPFNDAFRAVHDVFGHAKEGYEFGPRGEYNAFLAHSSIYSDEAKPALAAETLGQNAWVNAGAHLRDENGNLPKKGEAGYIPPAERPFAEQKATTMDAAQFQAPKKNKDEVELRHWSNVPGLKVLDPALHGTGLSGDERARQRDYSKIYVPRTYFGTKDYTKEPNLGPEQYRAFVKSKNLYPFQEDPKDLWPSPEEVEKAGYAPMDSKAANTLYENKISKAGYEGYVHRDASVAAKFTKTPVKYVGNEERASFQAPLPAPKPEEFAHEDTIETALAKPNWMILTGTQEAQGAHSSPENVANNDRLYNELVKAGHTPIEVSGSYQGVDQGRNFLVTGVSPEEALDWGKKFKQDSVLTPHGLLYSDGSVQPPDATQTKIGAAAEKEPYFSRVENGPAFSLGFDEKVKPEAAEQLLGEDLGTKKPLSSKQVGDMTKAQLAAHYPESVIPKGKDDLVDSKIENSPLSKEAGSRPEAIKAFSKKLVDFARKMEKSPGYQAGLKWYSEFVPKLKKVYGEHAQIMAELLAATSPNNAPDTNFGFANDALEGYVSGRFDKLIAKFEEGLGKMTDGSWEKWLDKNGKNLPAKPSPATFLDQWITKHNLNPRQSNGQLYGMHSVPVLKVFARKWLENTSGPKTQNFVKNLLGTGHGATIDVWADRTMRRLGYADHQARWRILPKNGTGVSDADFAFSQEAFKRAADELGIEADALQGGLWFAEKQLWADNGWGRLDLGDYRKEIAKTDLLKSGITQRLAVQKAKARTTAAEQTDLFGSLVSPRKTP